MRTDNRIGGIEIPDSVVDSLARDFTDGLEELIAQGPELEDRYRIIETRRTARIRRLTDRLIAVRTGHCRRDEEEIFLRQQGMLPGWYGRHTKRRLW